MKITGKVSIFAGTILSVFGSLFLLVEIFRFFGGQPTADYIREFWWCFLVAGVIFASIRLWPRRRMKFQVIGRDASIELVRGNIFKESGHLIIGSNTSFETSPSIIDERSLQGSFTKKHCESLESVNKQISSQVSRCPVSFGKTVKVEGRRRTAYFCAIASFNEAGVAQSNFENLQRSFGELWSYLSKNATKGTINVPVLGSGFSRVTARREDIVKEIVQSFIAALSESTFCDQMRIVLHSKDVIRHNIDLESLADFIKHCCNNASPTRVPTGFGVPEE